MAARLVRFNPGRPQHSWRHDVRHWYFCRWCRLVKENQVGSGSWYQVWTWPYGMPCSNERSGEPVEPCRGPDPARALFLQAAADDTVRVWPNGDADWFVAIDPLPDIEIDFRLDPAVECGFAEADELVVLDGSPDGLQVARLTDLGHRWLLLAAEVPVLVGAGRR